MAKFFESIRHKNGKARQPVAAETSTSTFGEQSLASGEISLELSCLVEGQSMIFYVNISRKSRIAALKKLIHQEKEKTFCDVDASDIRLIPVAIELNDGIVASLSSLKPEGDVIMTDWKPVSDFWPTQPADNPPMLRVFVKFPDADQDQPPSKRARLFSPPLQPPLNVSLREATVSALHERLKKYSFIQVRGTPASGKTMLAQLLAQYIRQQEPASHVIWVGTWPLEQVKGLGGYHSYLRNRKGWVEGKVTVFIFDEAQLSYEDSDLWIHFFRPMRDYSDRRAIVFASYGSPDSRFTMLGIPIQLDDSQRVTLRPIPHKDGLQPAGLSFTRTEFDDLISKRYPNTQYRFDSSFFDAVFDLTGGHVGAICDFVQIIAAHDSYRDLKRSSGQSYTWDSFCKTVGPRDLLARLEASATIFTRGLPENEDIQNPAIANIFSAVLRNGVVTQLQFTGDDQDALQECFRQGWLHTDKLIDTDQPNEVGYFFTSSLHRWFVAWKLYDTVPAIPFETGNLLQFVVHVISNFSPRLLSTERRIGPGCIQRRPEAQYQDEFYRCCHKCSNGSLVTFPEFGTAKGRVDFYIPAKKWGVELVRDGDRLAQHFGRFSGSGSYGTTLALSDYIILDCRTTNPVLGHANLPKLHHVVFSGNFLDVSILDNKLELVDNGEVRLLVSS